MKRVALRFLGLHRFAMSSVLCIIYVGIFDFVGSFYDNPLHYSIISVRYYKGDIYNFKTSLQVTVLTSLREKNPRAERLLRELRKR